MSYSSTALSVVTGVHPHDNVVGAIFLGPGSPRCFGHFGPRWRLVSCRSGEACPRLESGAVSEGALCGGAEATGRQNHRAEHRCFLTHVPDPTGGMPLTDAAGKVVSGQNRTPCYCKLI